MIFVPQFFHSLMEWGEGAPPRKKKEKGRKDEDQGENPEAKELRGILCSLFWCWQCVFWLVCCGEFCPLLFECCLKELSKRLTKSGQICWQRNLGSCPKKIRLPQFFFEIKCRRSFFQEGEDGEEVPKEVMIQTIKLRDHWSFWLIIPFKEALFLRLALGVVPNQIPNQNLRQMCLDKSTTVVRLFLLMEVAEKYSGSQLLNTESARRATWIRISTSLNWVLTHTAKKQLEMTCFHLKPRDWSLINIYADPSSFKILKNDNGCFIIPGDIIVPTGPGY